MRNTGLHYNYFMDYDPALGRYLQSDPIGLAGGINTYLYAKANPLNFIDPFGLIEYIGIPKIERALERLARAQGDDFHRGPYYAPERAMLNRLRLGFDDPADAQFYHHEKGEADLCEPYFDRPDGEYLEKQREIHEEILRNQGNTWRDLYHPLRATAISRVFSMSDVVTIEREFRRQAGPRTMYGCVKLLARFAKDFLFEGPREWPDGYQKSRYDAAILEGIQTGLREMGYQEPIGHFQVSEVKFSINEEANVPFAYGEAATQATIKAVERWPKRV